MNKNEQINIIINNLHETISNLTDAKSLLEQNKKTKIYFEDFAKFENECHSTLSCEDSNKLFDIIVNYEQSIGIAAFLTGFQKGVQSVKTLEDKNFVANMLDKLM